MKVTNWRRTLATTLVAGGLISPAEARAANLDTNLVANAGFETVDTNVTGDYSAPKILNWLGNANAFAYSHQPGITGVPDYADGSDPPNAGNWYFTSNNNPTETDFNDPGDVYQDISVSAGASGTQIAGGEAAIRLSAYMSSYLDQTDFGVLHVDFRNAGGTSLGTAQVVDLDPGADNVWSLTSGAAMVPVGTATLRASVFGLPMQEGAGADGYIDNVQVQVTAAANEFVFLHVNTTTGQVAIKNQTGDPVQIDYYEVTSAGNRLNPVAWNSLQDQNLAGFPAGNGTGNGWEQGGAVSAGAIGEAYLTGSSSVTNNASIGLGAAFVTGGAQDLVFRYSVVSPQLLDSDFDGDGDADGADFLTWQRGNGTITGATKAQGDADADGAINAADLAVWRGEFGTSAFGGPGTLVQGFVRYATIGPVTVTPEPTTIVMAWLGIGVLVARRR